MKSELGVREGPILLSVTWEVVEKHRKIEIERREHVLSFNPIFIASSSFDIVQCEIPCN
jgi:hypothetical protein